MKKLSFSLLIITLFSLSALAARIQSVAQDTESNQLIIDVLYEGTSSDHEFQLTWGKCLSFNDYGLSLQTDAHLDDLDGSDLGREIQTQRLYFSLENMNCRPSWATVRTSRTSFLSLKIQ